MLVDFTSYSVCSGAIKKGSENDQSTDHFQSFSRPPDPKSEKKNPVNQLIKILALSSTILMRNVDP